MKLSQRDMLSAMELTKSGKLIEATAYIQNMLRSHRPANTGYDVGVEAKTIKGPELVPKTPRPSKLIKEEVRPERMAKGSGSKFETKNFTCRLGQRVYKLFTPSVYTGQSLPLVVMLHGCSQTAEDFAVGTNMNAIAEEMGFFVAYPAQATTANTMGCWNWFQSSDQKKGSGEPELIAGIVRKISEDYVINSKMVYVAGLSAGGAMAAILGMTHPDLFAAIGVHSGLPCGAAKSTVGAFKAMKRGAGRVQISNSLHPVPTIVFHGDNDRTVDHVNSADVIAQFDTAGAFELSATETGSSEGGLNFSRSVYLQENGTPLLEQWTIHGAGHAWSGGSALGSFTEPRGPDASREIIRFFFEHELKWV